MASTNFSVGAFLQRLNSQRENGQEDEFKKVDKTRKDCHVKKTLPVNKKPGPLMSRSKQRSAVEPRANSFSHESVAVGEQSQQLGLFSHHLDLPNCKPVDEYDDDNWYRSGPTANYGLASADYRPRKDSGLLPRADHTISQHDDHFEKRHQREVVQYPVSAAQTKGRSQSLSVDHHIYRDERAPPSGAQSVLLDTPPPADYNGPRLPLLDRPKKSSCNPPSDSCRDFSPPYLPESFDSPPRHAPSPEPRYAEPSKPNYMASRLDSRLEQNASALLIDPLASRSIGRPQFDRQGRRIEFDQYGNALRRKRPPPPDGYEYVEELELLDSLANGPVVGEAPAVNDYYSKPLERKSAEFLPNNFRDADFGGLPPPLKRNRAAVFEESSDPCPPWRYKDSDVTVVPIDTTAVGYERTALQVLNEKYPGLEWEILKMGPVHRPFFTAQVTIGGQLHSGTGGNKKEARLDCAQNIIDFLGIEKLCAASNTTAEAPAAVPAAPAFPNPVAVQESQLVRRAKKMQKLGLSSYVKSDRGKTPVQLIHEKCLGQSLVFELVGQERIPPNHFAFTMQCCVNGTRFYGTAKDKKTAKQNAARQALTDLFNWIPPAAPTTSPLEPSVDIIKPSTELRPEKDKDETTPVFSTGVCDSADSSTDPPADTAHSQ